MYVCMQCVRLDLCLGMSLHVCQGPTYLPTGRRGSNATAAIGSNGAAAAGAAAVGLANAASGALLCPPLVANVVPIYRPTLKVGR